MRIQVNARLDARDELITELEANGSDAELILLAYEKWDDECVKHLIGDFAFAILQRPAGRFHQPEIPSEPLRRVETVLQKRPATRSALVLFAPPPIRVRVTGRRLPRQSRRAGLG